jgi:hypothetical protein
MIGVDIFLVQILLQELECHGTKEKNALRWSFKIICKLVTGYERKATKE